MVTDVTCSRSIVVIRMTRCARRNPPSRCGRSRGRAISPRSRGRSSRQLVSREAASRAPRPGRRRSRATWRRSRGAPSRTRPSSRTSVGRDGSASARGRGTACAGCVEPGRLQVAERVHADPDLTPRRRDRELGHAFQRLESSMRPPRDRDIRSPGHVACGRFLAQRSWTSAAGHRTQDYAARPGAGGPASPAGARAG